MAIDLLWGSVRRKFPFSNWAYMYMFVKLSWAAAATRNPRVSTALLHHSRRRQQWVTTCLPARNLSNQSSAPSVMSISAHGLWNIYRLEWEHTHKYCRNSHWNVHKMFLTFYYRAKLSALGDRQTNIEVNITPALDGWLGDGWMAVGIKERPAIKINHYKSRGHFVVFIPGFTYFTHGHHGTWALVNKIKIN